jgi:pilus assembly protein Flp/PilA
MKARILVRQLWRDERGQDLTEYALLLILVALGAIAAMSSLSTALSKAFSSAAVNLST